MHKALSVVVSLAAASAASIGLAKASAPVCLPGEARPPAVVTDHTQAVTATTATLHAKVNPHGCSTTYHFEYGTTTAYGNVTTDGSAGSGTQSALVAANISGLPPRTLFHVRIVATSGAGSTVGGDLTFKTGSTCAPGGTRPPAVVTDPAVFVGATRATLRGKVNAHGCSTTYHFEFGRTGAYGQATANVPAGSGTQSILATANVNDLAANTLFHFRIVASSAAGSTAGADFSFTTGFPLPSLRILGAGRAPVKRGFVAAIPVRCVSLNSYCQSTLMAFYQRRPLGRQSFLLGAGRRTTVSLRLNRRGRDLLRHHRRHRAVLVIHGYPSAPPVSIVLVRKF